MGGGWWVGGVRASSEAVAVTQVRHTGCVLTTESMNLRCRQSTSYSSSEEDVRLQIRILILLVLVLRHYHYRLRLVAEEEEEQVPEWAWFSICPSFRQGGGGKTVLETCPPLLRCCYCCSL